MIVSIHQPYYFPWLGYFEKVLKADIFVILDDVQYEKNNFYNRNRVKTANGATWITVPVMYKSKINLMDITIDEKQKWQKKHFDTIFFNYKKAPFFKEHEEFLENIFKNMQWEKLIDINLYTLKYLFNALEIRTPIKYASKLNINSTATQRLIDITKAVGADTYLSGSSGKNYMDLDLFNNEDIKILYQDYKSPKYTQLDDTFESNLSILDLLLNHGAKSKEIILSNK